MSAFQDTKEIERLAWADLEPLIRRRAHRGQFVSTDKGRHSREMQKSIGDVISNAGVGIAHSAALRGLGISVGDVVGTELKAEEEEKYGNFFLEEWSNKKWETLGWLHTLDTDLLWYYFLDTRNLYEISFHLLKKWWEEEGRHCGYDLKRQRKHEQLNDTWGWCVPIADVCAAIPAIKWSIDSDGFEYAHGDQILHEPDPRKVVRFHLSSYIGKDPTALHLKWIENSIRARGIPVEHVGPDSTGTDILVVLKNGLNISLAARPNMVI